MLTISSKFILFIAIAGALNAGCNFSRIESDRFNRQLLEQSKAEQVNYRSIQLESISSPLQGTYPQAIALAAFADIDSSARLQEVRVEFFQTHLAVVTITQTDIADNSIVAIRHRVELVATAEPDQTDKEWKIVWAGQVKCQPKQGSQDWSNQKCF